MLKIPGRISAAVQSGQGLTEYTLLFCITVIVCYTGFALLFKTFELNVEKADAHKSPTLSILDNAAYAAMADQSKTLPPATVGEESVCLKDNGCLDIPIIKQQTLLQTSGRNGGELTLAYSGVLSQIAKKLNNNPNGNPKVAQLITHLANQGQQIGDGENNLTASCPAGHKCYLPINQLLDQVDSVHSVFTQFQITNTELDNYLSQNPQTLAPAILSVIHSQSANITKIANSYTSAKLMMYEDPSGNAPATQQWNITQNATVTPQDANTICKQKGIQGSCLK